MLCLSVCVALVSACAEDQNQAPEEAARLWERIHDEDFTSWETAPGYESPRPSNAPHSDLTQVYLNEVVFEASQGPPIDAWPAGSLIVKEGRTEDGVLELVAAMEKRDDGWFWAEWDDEGNAEFSGKPDVCIDCHSGAEHDSVFVLPLPR